MTDIEKVIEGLKHCNFGNCGPCYENDCPYYQSHDCTDELKNDILSLLKEPEAVKPQLSISGMWYECPICHRHLTKNRDNYCARCGRAVKWDA